MGTETSSTMDQRYFGRRLLAFVLDIIVAQLIAALLFAAAEGATGISLGDSSFTTTRSECSAAPANHPQVLRIQAMWPLPAGAERQNLICKITRGGSESLIFVTKVITREGTTTYTRQASYSIDKDGQPLPIDYGFDFSPVVILLYFILLSARGWRTPGKSAMGLRIVTETGEVPGWAPIVRREVLKLLPVLLYGLLVIWVVLSQPAILTSSEEIITAVRDGRIMNSAWMWLSIALGIATLIWWIGPFALWRGRTWHDRLAGTRIVLSERPKRASAPPQA